MHYLCLVLVANIKKIQMLSLIYKRWLKRFYFGRFMKLILIYSVFNYCFIHYLIEIKGNKCIKLSTKYNPLFRFRSWILWWTSFLIWVETIWMFYKNLCTTFSCHQLLMIQTGEVGLTLLYTVKITILIRIFNGLNQT